MSSRRYQEDIRRIVGLQDTLRGLDDELPRIRIEGSRGIFLIGAGETKSGAAPGVDEDGEATDPLMPDENEDNLNEDGSGAGGSGTDPSETDGSDLLTDPEDYGGFSPDDSTFGGGWGSGGVSTFTDCASGKCIEIVERGGYVPPDGWDEEKGEYFDPIFDDFEVDGRGWCLHGSGGGCQNDSPRWTSLTSVRSYLISERGYQGVVAEQLEFFVRMRNTNPEDLPGQDFRIDFASVDYIAPPPHPSFIPKWPSDNCIQLAPNGSGQWAASSREPAEDMTAKYSEAKSILDLCAPNGDGVQILPGADGGSVRWNYTQGRFMATSPEGRRSFGGATELTTAVAGSVKDGGAIKAQGAPVPTT